MRRPFLGAAVREYAGVMISRVVPGSMAAQAELAVGDVIAAIDDAPIETIDALSAGLRRAASQHELRLRIVRDGEAMERALPVVAVPCEQVAGCEVRYGAVEVGGARLRTIATVPLEARACAAIVFASGLRCASVDFALSPGDPIAQLLHAIARAGFATMRIEKPGIGDSEGPPCSELDLAAEIDLYAEGIAALRNEPAIDSDRIFVLGHSVGALIAALLAERVPLAGVIAYGGTALRWRDCLREGVRRQIALRGGDERTIADRLRRFDADPFGERFGRSLELHRQLDEAPLERAWRALQAPLLVVIGEHDWVVGEEEQRAIAALAPRAEIVEIAGLDHAFTFHPDRAASLRDYGRGAIEPHLSDAIAKWLSAHR